MQKTTLHWNNHRYLEILKVSYTWDAETTNYKAIVIWRTFIRKTDMLGNWGSVRSSRWDEETCIIKVSLFFYSHCNPSKATVKIPLVLKPPMLLLPCKPDDCLKSQNKLFKQLSIIGWYPVLELLGPANWNGPLVSIYEKVTSLNNNHEHGCYTAFE